MKIPATGLDKEKVFERLSASRQDDLDWRSGRAFAYIFDAGPAARQVIDEAFVSHLGDNALDPTAFPSARVLETEVVDMVREHLGGGEQVVGNFTSGGTESIMLAVKTARDWARQERPEIREPEMILPVTAHAAFHKAAHYLGVKPVVVDVDPSSFRADPEKVKAAITPHTILLVGSAVSYAHSVVDPIVELGKLALERGLLLHVDACMGGFLLPYFRRLGEPVPDFDMSVPGVTSLSVDLHKYGFAAKGASVVLYRDKDLRRHQIFTCADWSGYVVSNMTIQSSKSAGPVAAAWAALSFIGDDGYLEIARKVLAATQRVKQAIEASKDLYLLGHSDMNLVAFASDTLNIFHVADEMTERGWHVQPQLAVGSSTENIHLTIGPNNAPHMDAFVADLERAVAAARELPKEGPLESGLKSTLASIQLDTLDAGALSGMLAMAGIGSGGLPKRMAEVNGVLNACPPLLRKRLITEFMNELFVP